MFKTKRSIQARNQWFGLGRIVSAEIEAFSDSPATVFPIKEITLGLLRGFPELTQAFKIHDEDKDKKTIQNLRGRPFSTITPLKQQDAQASIEELLLLTGLKTTINSGPENNHIEEKFLFSLLTKFESFGKNVINYELSSREILPKSYRPCDLQKIEEALTDEMMKLNQLRLGFEKFRPRFLSTYTGMTPTIYGYFYLELTPSSLRISAQQQYATTNQALPFETEGYLQTVIKALSTLGISLSL